MAQEKEINDSKGLIKSSAVVGGMTFISRISGFLRDVVFANIFGASAYTDAFFISFKIPNFFRRLFAEGALIQAFVPILNDIKENDRDNLKKFISYMQGNLALILILIVTLGIIFSETVINIFAPGFGSGDDRLEVASAMLKITFPYLFFISLTALSAGILNTHNRFFLPAITPVILNLSLILSAFYLTGFFENSIIALAYGVFFAGVLQYLIQLPALSRLNVLVFPRINFNFHGVNRVLKLMLPAALGSAVVQLNLVIDSIVASFLAVGSISWLYYSDRLVEFPLAILGIAIATVTLPTLSKKFSQGNIEDYKKTLYRALRIVMILSIPAMAGLIVLAEQLLFTLFKYGSFDSYDVNMSALSLLAYSVGLPAFILMKVLLTGFFSRQDTKTPVKFGIIAISFNITFNTIVVLLYFKNAFEGAHAFLALATSLSAWLQVILLSNRLKREEILDRKLVYDSNVLKSLFSSILMYIAISIVYDAIGDFSETSFYLRGLYLFILIGTGVIVYFSIMKLAKVSVKDIFYGNN